MLCLLHCAVVYLTVLHYAMLPMEVGSPAKGLPLTNQRRSFFLNFFTLSLFVPSTSFADEGFNSSTNIMCEVTYTEEGNIALDKRIDKVIGSPTQL